MKLKKMALSLKQIKQQKQIKFFEILEDLCHYHKETD